MSEEKASAKLDVSVLGTPGLPGVLQVVAKFENDPRTDLDRLHDRSPRKFEISALLSKSKSLEATLDASFTHEDGSSYIIAPDGTTQFNIHSSLGNFVIKPNNKGEIALVMTLIEATSAEVARHTFFSTISPFIDHLSYKANCPIWVSRIRANDLKNQITSIYYITPYPAQILPTHNDSIEKDLFHVYALYREAMNSDSYFYKFFCYYKIMEGLQTTLRTELYSKARKAKLKLPKIEQYVPDHQDLTEPLKLFIGKPIREVFDRFFSHKYRNAVAHFSTYSGTTLNPSCTVEKDKYSDVLLLADLCCRVLIEYHETQTRNLNSANA